MTEQRPLIAVLDYGIGNTHSAQKALEKGGADARLTRDAGLIAEAAGVVLPGVGAFGACMSALRSCGLEAPALDAVASGRPFLGICVGMQMLFTKSEEDAAATGLDVLPGTVCWIPPGPKIPQMQWNRLDLTLPDDPMLHGLGDDAWVYFVHSLHGVPDDPAVVAATVEYGTTINAAFRLDNVFAAQFHPEKSSRPGLALLRNFVRTCTGVVPSGTTETNTTETNTTETNTTETNTTETSTTETSTTETNTTETNTTETNTTETSTTETATELS